MLVLTLHLFIMTLGKTCLNFINVPYESILDRFDRALPLFINTDIIKDRLHYIQIVFDAIFLLLNAAWFVVKFALIIF